MELYPHMREAIFLSRPNRFIALCEVNGEPVRCHVKNTGRLRELLLPGARVLLAESGHPARKTAYDLVTVEAVGYWVNIDSQAPNRLYADWVENGGLHGLVSLRAETVYGDSRFDFAYERMEGDRLIRGFAEIKGVTLFDAQRLGIFPDAPTERGVKHLRGLMAAAAAGYEARVCFVAQRADVLGIRPNDVTHPAFGEALRAAVQAGVIPCGYGCEVEPGCCRVTHEIPVILD